MTRLRCWPRCCAKARRWAAQGILTALWDFHIRHDALARPQVGHGLDRLSGSSHQVRAGVPDLHRPGYEYSPYREAVDFKYDVHNSFFQTRIGNDSDLIHFFKSSGPELEDALLDCLKGADDSMKINVLKAGSTLSESGDARFTLAALNLQKTPAPRCARRSATSTRTANVEF